MRCAITRARPSFAGTLFAPVARSAGVTAPSAWQTSSPVAPVPPRRAASWSASTRTGTRSIANDLDADTAPVDPCVRITADPARDPVVSLDQVLAHLTTRREHVSRQPGRSRWQRLFGGIQATRVAPSGNDPSQTLEVPCGRSPCSSRWQSSPRLPRSAPPPQNRRRRTVEPAGTSASPCTPTARSSPTHCSRPRRCRSLSPSRALAPTPRSPAAGPPRSTTPPSTSPPTFPASRTLRRYATSSR